VAEAAQDAELDDQALQVDCDMAQAFEIPRENQTAHNGRLAIAAADIAELPATLSRSPLPVRSSGWIGLGNMGSVPAACKRLDAARARPVTRPIPGSAIG